MTKRDIVSNLSKRLGVERSDIKAVLEIFMVEIKSSLSRGESVYLRGFGSFISKERAAKKGRDIKRGIEVDIPAHKIPFFKPSKDFLDLLKSDK